MQSNILDSLGFDPGILMIAMMLIMVFVLVYMVRVSMKLTRFLKRYRIFMRGKDAVSLEKAFAQKFLDVDHLIEVTKNQANEISKMKEILSRTTNKIGIVKYDAFPAECDSQQRRVLYLCEGDRKGRILHRAGPGRKRSSPAGRELSGRFIKFNIMYKYTYV